MLTFYQTQTQALLQSPGAPTTLYALTDINRWINVARGQIAGEGEAIVLTGTISTVVGQRNYNFASINIGTASVTGVQGILNVEALRMSVGQGQAWMAPRPWQWFQFYHLNNPVPLNGPPKVWAQFGQGSSGQGSITGQGTGTMASGNFYIDPPPDSIYTLNCDCVCYPQALALDTDVEAIPYLWTDAVPYFAAWYALLSSQTSARQADAARMMEAYETFMQRARAFSNPTTVRDMYRQTKDPTRINKLAIAPKQQGAAQ